MSKLVIALAIGIAAASIIGGTCLVVKRRRKQQQYSVLTEPLETDFALAK
ncbi:MAG TPA: hypothetical protein VH500_21720 [Nitrososphaeraceae archaeon]|jgi:hypothetical protein